LCHKGDGVKTFSAVIWPDGHFIGSGLTTSVEQDGTIVINYSSSTLGGGAFVPLISFGGTVKTFLFSGGELTIYVTPTPGANGFGLFVMQAG
jgi:hypothetical protein